MRKYYFSLPINLPLSAFTVLFFTLFTASAQVGIGTTSPKATLDVHMDQPAVNGVTGFLVPRVNNLYSGTDIEPGLMVFYTGSQAGMQNTFYVYNEDYGWQTIMNAGLLSVGDYDSVNEGVVFWVNPNDPTNYKIVSLVDLDFNGDYTRDWASSDNDLGNNSESFNDGYTNTETYVNYYSNGSQSSMAPWLTWYYNSSTQNTGVSHTMWYMGARGEWEDLYESLSSVQSKLVELGATQLNIGSNSDDHYWTSEQKDNNEAYDFDLSNGNDSSPDKDNSRRIRAFKEIGG